ncbi:MAG: sterol desaturase family protein [Pseudomonadota bacterium]
MTLEKITELGTTIDETFFLIGAAILAIEILKALFSGSLTGKSMLDMVASASTQIPYLLVEVFILGFAYVGYVYVSESFVTWTMPVNAWTIGLALLAADFVYYWEHRIAHEVRLLWTQHAVHHSSRYMNMVVGIRFGPLEGIVSAVFHLPLVLIGFPAELVFFGIIVVLAYQTWIHTELVGKLGPLERIINTPSNHRVHHGCDDKYMDKNYGGILMVWDQLFGTYQAEEETPRYGLKRDFDSVNPPAVWFSELPALIRDMFRARSTGELLRRILGRPDWRPQPQPGDATRS